MGCGGGRGRGFAAGSQEARLAPRWSQEAPLAQWRGAASPRGTWARWKGEGRSGSADKSSMALFTWKLAYLTGISVIDADHARLFNLAKSLHSALAQGSGAVDIEERLAALVEHTRAHFAREEALMAGEDYPGL